MRHDLLVSALVVQITLPIFGAEPMPSELQQAISARIFSNYSISIHHHHAGRGSDVLIHERSVGPEWLSRVCHPSTHDDSLLTPILERHTMVWNGQRWETDGRSAVATLSDDTSERDRFFPQGIGLLPQPSGKSPESMLRELSSSAFSYSIERAGHVSIITAKDSSGTGYRWILTSNDPPLVTRVERIEADGAVSFWASSSYDRYKDKCYPSSVDFGDFSGMGQSMFITDTAINESTPPKIGPDLIGIEVGTNIRVHDAKKGKTKTYGWDGWELRPYGEIVARIRAGSLQKGANFVRTAMLASAMNAAGWHGDSDTRVSEWERYVAFFIDRCGLDKEQTALAWQVYRTALEPAERYLLRKKTEFRALERDLSAALNNTASGNVAESSATARRWPAPLKLIHLL